MPEDDADTLAGFIAAICAPALIAGIIALPYSVLLAGGVILAVGMIATLHVVVIALPVYLLISRFWRPGPATVLVAAPLVGALPLSLLVSGRPQLEAWPLALFGLAGGCAFLVFANRGPVADGY